MGIGNFSDKIDKAQKRIKQTLEQHGFTANSRNYVREPQENHSSSIIIQLSLKDLVERYSYEQQRNPVIQNCNVSIEKVHNHPNGDLFKINQIFLDEKKEYIFTDASRQKVKGVIYMAVTLDTMLMRRLADNDSLEFDL